MNYVEISFLDLNQLLPKHTYLIELDENRSFNRGIIVNINKDDQSFNMLCYGRTSGESWAWLDERGVMDLKFSEEEIKKHEIPKYIFEEKWQQANCR